MARLPLVVKVSEIVHSECASQRRDGRWLPARWEPFYPGPIGRLIVRLRLAWAVFCGKRDAFDWEDTNEDN